MPSEPRRPRRPDDSGQMMLLAAIVLLIAFVSMAVMIARVTLVASETSRDQHGPFLREAESVVHAVNMLDGAGLSSTDLGDRIADLQAFEAARGYLLSWDCNAQDGATNVDDVFRLTDGRSVILIELPGATACS